VFSPITYAKEKHLKVTETVEGGGGEAVQKRQLMQKGRFFVRFEKIISHLNYFLM